MNRAWHAKNKLSEGASEEERIKWHIAHQKNCGCRPIPKSLSGMLATSFKFE